MKLGFTTGTHILKKSPCNGRALAHPHLRNFVPKVMATAFWNSKGIILIDYKPAGASITGEYYANVIKQLRVAIKEKRRGKLAAGVLLLHDNAPVYVQSYKSGYSWVQVQAVKSLAIQSRPGPKWLLSVSKFEVPLAWNEISGWWWAQGCYRGLLWGPNRRLLFQRHRLLKRKVSLSTLFKS